MSKVLIQRGGCLVQKVEPDTNSMITTTIMVLSTSGEEQHKNICVRGDMIQNLKANAAMKFDDFIISFSELVNIVTMGTSILFIKAVSEVVFFHGGMVGQDHLSSSNLYYGCCLKILFCLRASLGAHQSS